jgi:hypothetical protein
MNPSSDEPLVEETGSGEDAILRGTECHVLTRPAP